MDAAQDFVDFVSMNQRLLLRTAWLLTGDWGTAEDLVKTALVRAWPHWSRVAPGEGADRYVRRVMIDVFNSWWRRPVA